MHTYIDDSLHSVVLLLVLCIFENCGFGDPRKAVGPRTILSTCVEKKGSVPCVVLNIDRSDIAFEEGHAKTIQHNDANSLWLWSCIMICARCR